MALVLAENIGRVALLRLNRPKKLNALNAALIGELNAALDKAEADEKIGAILLTGNERAFAAGADIGEMEKIKNYAEVCEENLITRDWERVTQCRKPVIAAVSGYALGGGCELAMMCDFVLAGTDAMFSQPEIIIGTMPGAGGSQRFARAAGKAKAMEMCLSGRMMDAKEAERCGIVARVVPAGSLQRVALETAQKIASHSLPVARMIKESVNAAFETHLSAGVQFERRLFHSTFALADRAEGMRAFLQKRKPKFKHK